MKKLVELLLIIGVVMLVVFLASAGGMATQIAKSTPTVDPNCPPLVNNGEKFPYFSLQACHVLQVIDIAADQSGNLQNDTGHDVTILWKGERKVLTPGWVLSFVGPGQLQAPVQ
jgi:hypothetical protein